MRAKVKDSCRWNNIRACAGAEFVKGAFRPVPAGREQEALACEMLEIEPEAAPVETEPEAAPAEMVMPADPVDVASVAAKPRRGKG